ncbi:MAG: ATP-binding cassette domain-containing protein [Crocinitomicaceae bacterium]
MSERILKALMQLFSIIARVDENVDLDQPSTEGAGREIVKDFLGQELNSKDVEAYLQKFDDFLISYQGKKKRKDGKAKRTSVHSVKVLRICTDINKELAQNQKVIVLLKILGFIYANDTVADQELEFAETVAETFNIPVEEYKACRIFVEAKLNDRTDEDHMLYVTHKESENFKESKHIYSQHIEGEIHVINVKSVNLYFFKYLGESALDLNGQVIVPGQHIILNSGSSIRSSKVKPIYYSDIIGRFLSDETAAKVIFKTEAIEYRFKNDKLGLREFNFSEESGKLLGIMGGSGAGKSTLLNVLNGNYAPSKGKVTINGIDIHHEKEKIEGVIGYVSQDDLLIEELTVFENLFYNAKLVFGNLNDQQIAKRVLKLLNALGLYESKDLKVGSPLDKTISGGQRKRLNISLELIREPSVLFVDEPTSGLSSRDSENIMDLLNELALKGKLIFVVIHQPSSDIFKMFDKLLILDKGGYPIYNGNPVDAVIYFKTLIDHVNCNESECNECGNVNPEQIFNIIEAKVVDEYGKQTANRKVAASEWNQDYRKSLEPIVEPSNTETPLPDRIFQIPGFLKQFKTYFIRDVKAKLTNRQYMFINMLEAPILAAFLAFFLKMYSVRDSELTYIFRENQNVPSFLFIAVIVALFIGLSVAAEEIIKDQKILKRESFLNLSKGSYLWSKISIMFLISAIQTVSFVLIGNWILGIHGMWMSYWLILFSLSCFANVLGLNISATFNSVKVIYILIPLIIIPQLLFSGVIVKFDKINPMFNREDSVPGIGNVMASRWAYEALSVTQFTENDYNKHLYKYEKQKQMATWKKDYWLKELGTKLNFVNNNFKNKESKVEMNLALTLLRNELEKEGEFFTLPGQGKCEGCLDGLTEANYNEKVYQKVNDYFETNLKAKYKAIVDKNRAYVDKVKTALVKRDGKDAYILMFDSYHNESLEQFVTNKIELDKIKEYNGQLVQKSGPIYRDPVDKGFFGAQFYAPTKNFFGTLIPTFWANVMVIWGMVLILVVTLYFDFFKKTLKFFENFSLDFFRKK